MPENRIRRRAPRSRSGWAAVRAGDRAGQPVGGVLPGSRRLRAAEQPVRAPGAPRGAAGDRRRIRALPPRVGAAGARRARRAAGAGAPGTVHGLRGDGGQPVLRADRAGHVAGHLPLQPVLRMSARLRSTAAVAALALASACSTQAHVSDDQAMQLTHGGRAQAGRGWAENYGCGGCHVIPGVPGARGRVGPPLDNVTARLYIGGVTENKPDNLIAWIQDPQLIDSATAMPRVGVTQREARDIAAYLYTLAH